MAANDVKIIPVNPEWETPLNLILEAKGEIWKEMAINRDHLGPRKVYQGKLRNKPSLWNKATNYQKWESKYS